MEPHNSTHITAIDIRFSTTQWHARLLLSCSWCATTPRGAQAFLVQHYLWAAHLCATIIRRYRLSWPAGQSLTEGRLMKIMKNKRSTTIKQDKTHQGVDESRLPVDSKTKKPLAPRSQPGYYQGFSALNQQAFWDEATRNVVMARVEQVPPIRYFTPGESRLMQAICDRLLPQDDRDEQHKIPVLNYIDDRLFNQRIDGY